MSFGLKCECNPELVGQSYGSLMNEKFSSLEEVCFELRKKFEVSLFRTWKSFLT
jgi:hypothetical protein